MALLNSAFPKTGCNFGEKTSCIITCLALFLCRETFQNILSLHVLVRSPHYNDFPQFPFDFIRTLSKLYFENFSVYVIFLISVLGLCFLLVTMHFCAEIWLDVIKCSSGDCCVWKEEIAHWSFFLALILSWRRPENCSLFWCQHFTLEGHNGQASQAKSNWFRQQYFDPNCLASQVSIPNMTQL